MSRRGVARGDRERIDIAMDFAFSEEQTMLRSSTQAFLRHRHLFADRRATLADSVTPDRQFWRSIATDLGVTGIGVSEARGGVGGGAVEHMIVMEELGRALASVPYLETVVIGSAALAGQTSPLADDLSSSIVAGDTILAFAWAETGLRSDVRRTATRARRAKSGWTVDGHKCTVIGAPLADYFLVPARTGGSPHERDGLSLFLVDRRSPGISERTYATVDGKLASDIEFSAVTAPAEFLLGREGDAGDLIDELVDRAIAGIASEAVGAMEQMHADTLAFVKDRKQFGQPLSTFQVLQHRLVDMYLQLELARSATIRATLKLDEPAGERGRAVSSAKVTVAQACRFVGQNAIQLHGGMGMTDEFAISRYFRRTTMIDGEFGTVEDHIARYAELAGPPDSSRGKG